jgi:hypothetical protein
MTIKNQDDYIKYRFKRAEESFEEALILIENKRWNASILTEFDNSVLMCIAFKK